MEKDVNSLSMVARRAVVARDWATVSASSTAILKKDPKNAEGHFLAGMVARAQQQVDAAIQAFRTALDCDPNRYDAAIELANQHSMKRQNGDAAALLLAYEKALDNSPRYLDLAGTVYSDIGMASKAWPLFKRANELQPGLPLFESNMATCAVFLGKIEEGRELYEGLLSKQPGHRKNHYQLSRLGKAQDLAHVEQMKQLLKEPNTPIARNIPLYFAIAKELEDLKQWDECFAYFKQACDAVVAQSQYDVQDDIALVDSIIEQCSVDWLQPSCSVSTDNTPIFIIGLPRTGTTLVERILSSHSGVESLGETLFLQTGLRDLAQQQGAIDAQAIKALSERPLDNLAKDYLSQVSYRLGASPHFIEKLPFNFLYAGFIAKAWPQAKFVHLVRNPMDACFSMYKQVFTWAYRYSYSLEDLGKYYVAYDRLRTHWKNTLGDRFVEVEYESLISNQEADTRSLLSKLELSFEEQCLHFEKNAAPSATASSVQVRSKVYSDSRGRWRRYESQLAPLEKYLSEHGIDTQKW